MGTTATLCLLGVCYFLGLTVLFAHIAATDVATEDLLKDDGKLPVSLATIPLSFLIGGSAVILAPAGMLMHRFGYKVIFLMGAILGIVSGGACFAATYLAPRWAFTVLALGVIPEGCAYGIVHYYRHVAALLGAHSEAATSWNVAIVITSGFLAGIAGPGLADLTQNAIGHPYAGTYLACAVVSVVHLVILCFAKVNIEKTGEGTGALQAPKRKLVHIVFQPDYMYAMLTAAVAHGVMVLIMGVTPLVIQSKVGFTASSAVIQVHVVFMYGPSFFTSKIIARFGAQYVSLFGIALSAIGTCAYFYHDNQSMGQWHQYGAVMIALAFVGLGWNFSFVGATTMVSRAYLPQEKFKAQAFNDTTVFGLGSVLTLVSGPLLDKLGIYAILYGNLGAYVLLFIADIVYLEWKKRSGQNNKTVPSEQQKSGFDRTSSSYDEIQSNPEASIRWNSFLGKDEENCFVVDADYRNTNSANSSFTKERF